MSTYWLQNKAEEGQQLDNILTENVHRPSIGFITKKHITVV